MFVSKFFPFFFGGGALSPVSYAYGWAAGSQAFHQLNPDTGPVYMRNYFDSSKVEIWLVRFVLKYAPQFTAIYNAACCLQSIQYTNTAKIETN